MKCANENPKDILKFQISHNQIRIKKTKSKHRSKARDNQINVIKKHIPSATSVLCLGCRSESELENFKEHGLAPTGIDILPSKHYIVMDAHEIGERFKEDQFDFVYASHSLEHLYDPGRVLRGIRKISRLGVFVVLPSWSPETPNYAKKVSPSSSHPAIYDLMVVNRRSLSEVTRKDLLDFQEIEPFDLIYYKKIDRNRKKGKIDECELLFSWKTK